MNDRIHHRVASPTAGRQDVFLGIHGFEIIGARGCMWSTPIGSVPGACRSTRLTGPESLCQGPWTDSGGTHRFVFAALGALLDGLPDNLPRIEPCRSRARAGGLSDGTPGRTGHVGPRWFHLRRHRPDPLRCSVLDHHEGRAVLRPRSNRFRSRKC